MNNTRRKSLREALEHLESAITIVTCAQEEESDCIDNCPENLQDSDRVRIMEDTVNDLEEAINCMESAIDSIERVIT